MANAIAHYGLNYEYDALIYYCIKNGILETPTRKKAIYFEKAKSRKFSTRKKTDYRFLKLMMDEC